MPTRQSIASILIFVGSILCFFLPFATVSCGEVKALTLTGRQLATGTTMDAPQLFGPAKKQKIEPHPFAAVAILCAVAGAGLSLLGRKMAAAPAAAGAAGAVSLFLMKTSMDSEIQKQGEGLIRVSYENGYFLAVLLLIAGSALNLYLLLRNKLQPQPVLAPPPPFTP